MAVECPICQNTLTEQQATICPRCAWDLTLYSFTPDDISKALIKQIDWARQMWKSQQKYLQEIELLKSSYNNVFSDIGALVKHGFLGGDCWKEANILTAKEIAKNAKNDHYYTPPLSKTIRILTPSFINSLDCELLSNIDKAWADNNKNKLGWGFRVQKSIFEKILRTYEDEDEDFIWSLFTVKVGWKQPTDQKYYKSLGNKYDFLCNRDYVKDSRNYKCFSFLKLSTEKSYCEGYFPLLNWLTDNTPAHTWEQKLINGQEGYQEGYKGFKSLMDRLTECSIG
ncbi:MULTISPECIES: GUN4 domain-containing protein [Kamptonema]|uniref:GUN4 domain-containing protein n=1 Tax=Kamptonema TaxID=1501433 RepID=UPI0001DAC1CC|nr:MULTISPECIES: GUN4 domain-containing protein [Kamptonema]CBN58969.1 hypothetical protein OSCI_3960015 [Kamptonema sp. PCC 6506]